VVWLLRKGGVHSIECGIKIINSIVWSYIKLQGGLWLKPEIKKKTELKQAKKKI